MIRAALLAAFLVPVGAFAQSAAEDAAGATDDTSSYRDYTDPAQRDRAIACKTGDFERRAGQTLGQLFGDAWPTPPAAATTRERATVAHWGRIVMPDGLPPRDVTVAVATLVGADGEPLRAEAICASGAGFDTAAARTVMRSRFTPTRYDGVAAVGATVVLVQYSRSGAVPGTGRRR